MEVAFELGSNKTFEAKNHETNILTRDNKREHHFLDMRDQLITAKSTSSSLKG
jgi:hypothetical protein